VFSEDFIRSKGKTAEEYISSVADRYRERWTRKIEQVELTEEQQSFLTADYFPIKIVAISADWCPDCQNAIPILMKFAEISSYIDLVLVDRDSNKEALNKEGFLTNGGMRIPLVIYTNTEWQKLGMWAERSALTYQLVHEAKKQAVEVGTDDYGQFVRERFRTHSKALFLANRDELYNELRKSVLIYASAAKLENFNQTVMQ
jgi:thiol-disulfide isomerase/thioredoxin